MANLSSLNFKLSANIAPFKKGLTKAERSMDRLGKKMQATGKNMSMKMTAPLVALGAVSFNVFKGFEAEMSKVQAVSGATADEFKALSENAKELGASTMFSASQVAQLQTEFAKLGFTADEITKVTEATLNLAQASGSDLARSAEVAGSTLRAFGLDASETGRVTDVMAKSFSTSALDMEHFANSMKFVAPVAKSAGMSIEETSAMLAVLANAGIKGSQAGTSLRRIISEIGASGKPTAEALKDLAEQGIGLADAKDEVGRSAQSALLILSEGVDNIKPLTQEFKNSAGAAKEMADIMGDTAFGAGKRLESALEGLGISIGEIVADAVVPMVEGFAKLASKLNKTSPALKKTAVVFAAVLASAGPLLFLTGGLIRNVRLLRFAMIKSNTVTKIAAAVQRAYNLALTANPIGVVIAGLAAFAAVLMLVNRRKKEVVETQHKLSEGAKKDIAETQVRTTQANKLMSAIQDQNIAQDQRKRLITKLNTEYGDLLPNLIDEKDATNDIATAQREMNKQVAKKIALMAAQDEMTAVTKKAVDAQTQFNKSVDASDELLVQMKDQFGRILSDGDLKAIIESYQAFTPEEVNLANAVAASNAVLKSHETELNNANKAVVKVGESVDKIASSMALASVEIEEVEDDVDGLGNGAEDAEKKLTKLANINYDGMGDWFDKSEENLANTSDAATEFDHSYRKAYESAKRFALKYKELNNAVAELMHRTTIDTIAGMAEIAGAMVMGEASFADMGSFLLGTFAGLLDQLGRMFIQYGISVEAFVKALAAGPTPMGAALAVGAGIAMIAAAGAIRAKMSKASEGDIPALAEGGIVTGPTLALVGEGRESEAVLPLSKLNALMNNGGNGSQRVEVVGRISGSDILLSQERATRQRTRQRGF